MPLSALQPSLDEFESTATLHGRTEKLSASEFELLSQLLRYPEEPMSRESLKRVVGCDDGSFSNRRLDATMKTLIRKVNVLHSTFDLIRFAPPDSYLYTETPPKRKPAD
jgi:DNA-binding response OmpR family regulator